MKVKSQFKRIAAVLCALTITTAFASCGSVDNNDDESKNEIVNTVTTIGDVGEEDSSEAETTTTTSITSMSTSTTTTNITTKATTTAKTTTTKKVTTTKGSNNNGGNNGGNSNPSPAVTNAPAHTTQPVHTTAHQHHWVKVKVKDAWDEKIKIKDAWDETKVISEEVKYYKYILKCGCGKRWSEVHADPCDSLQIFENILKTKYRPHYTNAIQEQATTYYDMVTQVGQQAADNWLYQQPSHSYTTWTEYDHSDPAQTQIIHHPAEYRTVHHEAEYVWKCTDCGATK